MFSHYAAGARRGTFARFELLSSSLAPSCHSSLLPLMLSPSPSSERVKSSMSSPLGHFVWEDLRVLGLCPGWALWRGVARRMGGWKSCEWVGLLFFSVGCSSTGVLSQGGFGSLLVGSFFYRFRLADTTFFEDSAPLSLFSG